MDDILKRLLDAEQQAADAVEKAKAEREKITRTALDEAHHSEQQFIARIPEIHESFLSKAQDRAQQTVAELQRRSDEHSRELRQMAETHEREAVEAALAILINPGSG